MLRFSGLYHGARRCRQWSAKVRARFLLAGLCAAMLCAAIPESSYGQSRRAARRTIAPPQVVTPQKAAEQAPWESAAPPTMARSVVDPAERTPPPVDPNYLLPAVSSDSPARFPSSRRTAQLPKSHSAAEADNVFESLPVLLACPHLKVPASVETACPEVPVQATASATPEIVSPANVVAEFAAVPRVVSPEAALDATASTPAASPPPIVSSDQRLQAELAETALAAADLNSDQNANDFHPPTAEDPRQQAADRSAEPAAVASDEPTGESPNASPESPTDLTASLFRNPEQFQVNAEELPPIVPPTDIAEKIGVDTVAEADPAAVNAPVATESAAEASSDVASAAAPGGSGPELFADLNRFRVQRTIPTDPVAIAPTASESSRPIQTEWLPRPQEPTAGLTARPVQDAAAAQQQESARENELLARMRQPLPQLPLNRLSIPVSEEQKLVEPERFTARHYGSYQQAGTIQAGPRELSYVQWQPQAFAWAAPNFYHRPLYFEEPNVERYGYDYGCVQPAVSAGHFFVSTLLLPMQIGGDHPCSRAYSLGYYRPGSCNPAYISSYPVTPRGLIYQTLSTVGTVFILP